MTRWFVLALLLGGCAAPVTAQYRDPKTGIIVEECIWYQQTLGGAVAGLIAGIEGGNEYATCKRQAEARGLERVR